jgi:CheY-like chemotaxis protein
LRLRLSDIFGVLSHAEANASAIHIFKDITKMNKKRILIADDEENMLITLGFILESAGYDISASTNGKQAMSMILSEKNNPFDLLILDVQMPYITGLQLIDELRHYGIMTPIIIMTGYESDELINELKTKDYSDYIEKPFDEDKLLAKIEKIIS